MAFRASLPCCSSSTAKWLINRLGLCLKTCCVRLWISSSHPSRWPIDRHRFSGTMQSMNIKVAVPTDDGETICQHFGQAKYFKVITLENNQVKSSELREKASHPHGDHTHSEGVHPGQQMVESISDCQ